MDEQQLSEIRQQFSRFDKDSNGKIDLDEFTQLLAVLSPMTDASFVQGGFALIDDNGDGFIDFEEFLDWWQEAEWET